MQENLLGYLMGALDEAQRAEVQAALEADPQLAAECARLEQTIAPLSEDEAWIDPPSRLAERTIALVEAQAVKQATATRSTKLEELLASRTDCPSAPPIENEVTTAGRTDRRSVLPANEQALSSRRWTLADAIVTACILAAAAVLLFPAIASSRHQAALTQCQNNLRQVGQALVDYSYDHDGRFPLVPANGKLGVAGIYAPILKESGRLQRDSLVLCPSSELAEEANTFAIPTTEEVLRKNGKALTETQKKMGGSFGYAFGYEDDNNSYLANLNRGRPRFAILADSPSLHLKDRQSDNHGGYGQNVLFEDGHVEYLRRCCTTETTDNVFLSDRGFVEAGRHWNDAVIGNSWARPVLLRNAAKP